MEEARKRFEMENEIQPIDESDAIYKYDEEQYYDSIAAAPWKQDVSHFQKVRISAIALIKMAMHARSGGDIEVMGLMQGKIIGQTMVVLDAFPLPVTGTETQVNPGNEAYIYITEYLSKSREIGKEENAIGWYHSHPGYGCWLSGIDVSTQMSYQQFEDPWLAVVIDPKRTIASGKVEIGAFRTYPEGYTPPDQSPSEYQTIPLNKIEDFGVHCKRYYPLETSFFKSSLDSTLLDLLWNKYWVNTLSSSPIFLNREYTARQVLDHAEKLKQVKRGPRSMGMPPRPATGDDSKLAKIYQDCSKTTTEQLHGLMVQVFKNHLFNQITPTTSSSQPSTMDIDS